MDNLQAVHNRHRQFLCNPLCRSTHTTNSNQIYLGSIGDRFQYRKMSGNHRGHSGAPHFLYT